MQNICIRKEEYNEGNLCTSEIAEQNLLPAFTGSGGKSWQRLGQFFWMCVPPKRKKLAVNNILRTGIANNEKMQSELQRHPHCVLVRWGSLCFASLS